jgi:hypothetical protein
LTVAVHDVQILTTQGVKVIILILQLLPPVISQA